MRWISLCLAIGIAVNLSGCQRVPSDSHSTQAQSGQDIAWREGDVDDALAEAKEKGKPVLLYWGAKWCPPCNQLKSTLFKDPAFIAETRNFVPVHLDGDTTGAQRWGERFGIRGYPTVIVLRADGSEIARLSGVATGLADVLRVAAARTTSIDALFEKAGANPASLSPDELQLLAAFDWQNDPKHFGDRARAAKLLGRLAEVAPEGPSKHHFTLLTLSLGSDTGPDGKLVLTSAQQAQIETVVPAVLANPAEVIANRQDLSYSVPTLIAALPSADKRAALGASLIKALDAVYADDSLPIPDRLATVNADLILGTSGEGHVPPAVRAKVRARVAWADGAAKEAMVRQSVISNAADLLHTAGDEAGAKALLVAELKRSAAPYYYMLDLAGLAEDEKDGPGAIAWARKAYEASEGPATRVQWAIEYSKTVLRQAPGDKAAVEASAQAVIKELGQNSGSYYQRTRIKAAAWGELLRSWSAAHKGGEVLARLDTEMAAVCAKQGDAAETCRKWIQAG